MRYQIAELKETAQGGYDPRGAVKLLWQSRDFETIVAGSAETGKTYGCCQYLDALLWKYPKASGVMVRKTYAALVPSALQTYQRIIGDDSPITAYGGEKPEWFDYPNGSRLWIAGLDNAKKVLSTERDFFYVNQAEELEEIEWEYLTTRATGRAAVMPYTRVFGDCNPAAPSHWIVNRRSLTVLQSKHEDNPTLFDEHQQITEQGRRSLGILDNLTGATYQRLRLGNWVQVEGAIYEEFNRKIHVIPSFPIPANWRRFRAIDFGYNNPFVCQWWALSPDNVLCLYREIYQTGLLVSDAAELIKTLSIGEKIEFTVADHDLEDRATLHAAGIPTIAAYKSVLPGIEAVQKRLRPNKQGEPTLVVFENALVKRDEALHNARKPVQTADEFEVYVWAKSKEGKPIKEEPYKVNDHGMDTGRYVVCAVDGIGQDAVHTAHAFNTIGRPSGASHVSVF